MLIKYKKTNYWIDEKLPLSNILDDFIKKISKPGEITNRENIYQIILAQFRHEKIQIIS